MSAMRIVCLLSARGGRVHSLSRGDGSGVTTALEILQRRRGRESLGAMCAKLTFFHDPLTFDSIKLRIS